MKLAIDVYYEETKAKAVGVIFKDWEDATPEQIITTHIDQIEPYESGSFYKRELPCIMQLMEKVDNSMIDEIIIDGYVYLDNDLKPGLGKYLYDELKSIYPIIGVAKTPFHHNKELVIRILRGESKNPLYITSVGVEPEVAAKHIRSMAGDSRMPYLLKLLDQHTKNDL